MLPTVAVPANPLTIPPVIRAAALLGGVRCLYQLRRVQAMQQQHPWPGRQKVLLGRRMGGLGLALQQLLTRHPHWCSYEYLTATRRGLQATRKLRNNRVELALVAPGQRSASYPTPCIL